MTEETVTRGEIEKLVDQTFPGLDEDLLVRSGVPLGSGVSLIKGKVRDILNLGNELLIVTTDRISAFDRVLTTIPCKGQVLNQISLFWFKATEDIIPNHILASVTPQSVLVKKCDLVPLEIVVRGYLTGSAWRDYRAGKSVSGFRLPSGMRFNEKFPKPLLTPSTKAERGEHDLPVSREEILKEKIVSEDTWNLIEEKALALYRRGAEIARRNGLILVDTKYEMGYAGDGLMVVDEMHTPDSSRYWYADSYEELFQHGDNQRELDKEYLRRWLMEQGFKGDGDAPEIPDSIRVDVAERYIRAYEQITGESFIADLATHEEITVSIIGQLQS